ncbi:hypothetical protein HanPSC8_Chr08g0331071 [Helianthus annuus]|nr:hypothetical protein HanPSC8_Chr08g0331071 [Helianthus annuus]
MTVTSRILPTPPSPVMVQLLMKCLYLCGLSNRRTKDQTMWAGALMRWVMSEVHVFGVLVKRWWVVMMGWRLEYSSWVRPCGIGFVFILRSGGFKGFVCVYVCVFGGGG